MKRLALAALLLLAGPLSALAAPASDAQVDRLIKVMRAQEIVQVMLPQVETQMDKAMQAAMAGRTLTPEQRAQMEDFMARPTRRMRDTLTWEKLEPVYRDIYRETFSAEEMDAM